MKRWISLLMAVLMVLTISACQKDSAGNANSGTNASAEGTKPENAKEGLEKYAPDPNKVYEIEWLGGWSNTPLSPNPKVEEYLEKKFNVKLNVWYIEYNKWNELLDLRFASGEVPDIIRTAGILKMNQYIKQNVIMPVSLDIIKKFSPTLFGMLNETDPNCWINVTSKGQNYGIPRVNIDGAYNYAPMWRKDWLQNIGIAKIPATLAETEAALYKFRNDDPDKNGKKDTYGLSSTGMRPIFGAFGIQVEDAQGKSVWMEDKNGKLVCAAVTPAAKEALAVLARWYKDGVIDPEFITGESHGGYWALSQDFANGKIGYTCPGAFYHISPPLYDGDIGSRNWQAISANLAKDIADASVGPEDKSKKTAADQKAKNAYIEKLVGYGENPTGPDGKTAVNLKWGAAGDEMVTFSAKLEKQPDKLGKILQMVDVINTDWDTFMMTEVGYLPGEQWYIESPAGWIQNPAKKAEFEAKKALNRNEGESNTFRSVAAPQMVKKYNASRYTWGDAHKQFTVNGVENQLKIVTDSQSKMGDELEKLRLEAYIKIISGEKPIGYFDEFVEKWNSIGGKKVTEEANEWWASIKK